MLSKMRRPITPAMIKLLGHSLANSSQSQYEISLRWSVILTAFWGSFRIGELLGKSQNSYNGLFTLLNSDIKFSQDNSSFSVWLRSPKVASRYGDVVEVWGLDFEIDHQLDPVIALKAYLSRKRNRFGLAPEMPAFVHEDGSLYSKVEFNKDLKLALSP